MLDKIRRRFFGLFVDLGKYKKGGERQAGFDLASIAKDHLERYKFASSILPKSGSFIDMACGVGYGSSILAGETERKVTGVDIGQEAIEFATRFYSKPNITYSNQDATKVNFPDNSFDVGVCFETIEHVPSDDAVLKSYQRVLKPGGKLIISHPNEKLLPYSKERFPYHVRHYFSEQMVEKLNAAGFTIEKTYYQNTKQDYSIREGADGSFLIYLCKKN